MFRFGLPKIKEAAHAEDRLSERTNLDKSILKSLRKDITKAPIPYGDHHVELSDGSFAVLKDVSRKGRKRHVVATVYSSDMTPPGVNIARSIKQRTPNKDVYLGSMEGPNIQEDAGSQKTRSKRLTSGRFGLTRNQRVKDSLRRVQAKGSYSRRKFPGGFSSSSTYSFSSSSRTDK